MFEPSRRSVKSHVGHLFTQVRKSGNVRIVPNSRQVDVLAIVNRTPFSVAILPGIGRNDIETVSVLVKATYSLQDGRMAPDVSEQQLPVVRGDEFFGDDPATSSVRVASDVCPTKPGTDVVLIGNAYPPRGRAETADVSLRVGPLEKTVRVFGERRWFRSIGAWAISRPLSFDSMPLRYERAFGGVDLSRSNSKEPGAEVRNPVGIGFVVAAQRLDGVPLPNLEDPRHLISRWSDRPPVAGFGVIGRHWMPRKTFAGTYGDAWRSDRCPLLPLDFDERYHNGAHPDLIALPRLRGGEPVRALGATRSGVLSFALPTCPAAVTLTIGTGRQEPIPALDTLIIEPDERRIGLSWRVTVPCPRQFLQIHSVRVNHV